MSCITMLRSYWIALYIWPARAPTRLSTLHTVCSVRAPACVGHITRHACVCARACACARACVSVPVCVCVHMFAKACMFARVLTHYESVLVWMCAKRLCGHAHAGMSAIGCVAHLPARLSGMQHSPVDQHTGACLQRVCNACMLACIDPSSHALTHPFLLKAKHWNHSIIK